jgi:hypothetical protein
MNTSGLLGAIARSPQAFRLSLAVSLGVAAFVCWALLALFPGIADRDPLFMIWGFLLPFVVCASTLIAWVRRTRAASEERRTATSAPRPPPSDRRAG